MPKEKFGLKERWIGSALLLAPFLILCVQYLDVPVGLFVKEHLYRNARWSRLTTNIPDLLLMVVLLTTISALSLYLLRIRKGIYDVAARLEKLLAWAAPVSYVTKDLLKSIFGRVNTRIWVDQPELYGFNWFHRRSGFEGFPSGHMLVIVALLAAVWRFYPKGRPYCIAIATALGVALILTNYHFLSDVVAGAYLGVLVETVVFRMLLFRERQGLSSSTVQ